MPGEVNRKPLYAKANLKAESPPLGAGSGPKLEMDQLLKFTSFEKANSSVAKMKYPLVSTKRCQLAGR